MRPLFPSSLKLTFTQTSCPISSFCTPPHAYPTTYPPPLRPPSATPPIEWPRTQTTSSNSPSTSTIDVDSLCLRFTKSLVIDENPKRVLQSKTSIFSLPTPLKRRGEVGSSRLETSKPLKKRLGVQPQELTTASPREAAKPRHRSVPPYFPSSSPKQKSTSRKSSAPTRVSTYNHATTSTSRETPYPAHDITSKIPRTLSNTSTANDPDIYPCSGSSAPSLQSLSSLDSTLGRMAYSPQDPPSTLAGPSTPSALLPDLLSEPFIASSTPVQLSPGFPIASIASPSDQSQDNCYLNTSLTSLSDYSVFMPGLTSGSFFSSMFDATIGSSCLSHSVPTPTVSDPFEGDLSTTYPAF